MAKELKRIELQPGSISSSDDRIAAAVDAIAKNLSQKSKIAERKLALHVLSAVLASTLHESEREFSRFLLKANLV